MLRYFHFYGLTIDVASDSDELLEEVRRHFAYFAVPDGNSEMHLELRVAAPPYSGLPAVPASVFKPRNVSFLTSAFASDPDESLEEVRGHFAYFAVPDGNSEMHLELRVAAPPYTGLPAVPASVFTPRNVSFL